MGAADDDRNVEPFLYARRDFEDFTIVRREERRDTDDIGPDLGYFGFDFIEWLSEVIVLMKGRERRFVRHRIIIGEISKLFRNRHRSSAAPAVIVFDDDFNIRKVFFDRGFEIAKSDGLQPHVGVVEVLNRRLDEQDFHCVKWSYSLSRLARKERCNSQGGERREGCAMHRADIEELIRENRTN